MSNTMILIIAPYELSDGRGGYQFSIVSAGVTLPIGAEVIVARDCENAAQCTRVRDAFSERADAVVASSHSAHSAPRAWDYRIALSSKDQTLKRALSQHGSLAHTIANMRRKAASKFTVSRVLDVLQCILRAHNARADVPGTSSESLVPALREAMLTFHTAKRDYIRARLREIFLEEFYAEYFFAERYLSEVLRRRGIAKHTSENWLVKRHL